MPWVTPLWGRGDLTRLSEDERPSVRRWAVDRLGTSYGEEAGEAIVARIADPDPEVAASAAGWGADLDLPMAADAILARYRSADGSFAGILAVALATLRDERLVEALAEREAAGGVGDAERVPAWLALAGLLTDRARDALLAAWRTELPAGDPAVVGVLAEALMRQHHPDAVQPVARALLTEHPPSVRDALIEAVVPALDESLSAGDVARVIRSPREIRQLLPGIVRRLEPLVGRAAATDLVRAFADGATDPCLDRLAAIARDLAARPVMSGPGLGALAVLTTLADGQTAVRRLGRAREDVGATP